MTRQIPIYATTARALRRMSCIRAGLQGYGPPALLFLRGAMASLVLLLVTSGATAPEQGIHCLALNIYFEARGEPEEGQLAVAHVVLNRVADRRWPDNACAVIAQGWPEDGAFCQFSWFCDGRSDIPRTGAAWRDANRLAKRVFWGGSTDPTGGAFWYHADYVSPWWSKFLRRGPKIGHHIFYLDPAVPQGPDVKPVRSRRT